MSKNRNFLSKLSGKTAGGSDKKAKKNEPVTAQSDQKQDATTAEKKQKGKKTFFSRAVEHLKGVFAVGSVDGLPEKVDNIQQLTNAYLKIRNASRLKSATNNTLCPFLVEIGKPELSDVRGVPVIECLDAYFDVMPYASQQLERIFSDTITTEEIKAFALIGYGAVMASKK